MRLILSFVIVFAAVFFTTNACAISKADMQVIQNYSEAVQTKDKVKIRETWSALNKNVAAMEYMKEKLPKHYKQFNLQGLSLREGGSVNRKRRKFIPDPPDPEEAESIQRKGINNRERVLNFPNQNRRSNSDIPRSSLNKNRISNQKRIRGRSNSDTVSRSPNQDRTSNQDRIKNRLGR